MKTIKIHYATQHSVRAKAVLWLLEKSTPLHALFNRKRRAWDLKPDDFLKFRPGSLGHTLGTFYRREQFVPVAKAERHDVFHVLLGYSTDVLDETAMQFFLWGNGKPSFFTVGTCVIGALLFPNRIAFFLRHYRKGARSASIGNWDFRQLLTEDLDALKNRIFI
jgi:ubiquinone biosynthesis protein Coq4